jgi:hypothetical protein
MNGDEFNWISERVIGCSFTVANTLGTGFLEKVYEMPWLTSCASRA